MKYKSIDLPGQEFDTKEELFKVLKAEKELIIGLKKATKTSLPVKAVYLDESNEVVKGITIKEGESVHVINTTGVLDSHNDLHVKGIWTKSVKEQKGKVFFLADHDMSISSVIAHPKDVNMSVKNMEWKDLGFKFEGTTDALVFGVEAKNIRHKEAAYIIENKVDIQHSVRMSYVKVELAINSDDKDFAEEKAVWNKYLPDVVNKEDAEEQGFMWIVKEAKIEKEGSMVLLGSNSATPMLNSKNEEKAANLLEKKKEEEKALEIEKNNSVNRIYRFI